MVVKSRTSCVVIQVPVEFLSLQMWMELIVPEDFEDNGLGLDVFDKGFGHFHGDLSRGDTEKAIGSERGKT